jgi:hypothetical protein
LRGKETKSRAGSAAAAATPAKSRESNSSQSRPPDIKSADIKTASARSETKYAHARRFPRFVLDVRLQVRMFQNGDFQTCWGRSTEIGQDGIGATLTGSLSKGEIVTLDIPLPLTPYPIKVRAIVRFCQGLRYGFEFLTMNDSQRDTVRRVCEYLASKS